LADRRPRLDAHLIGRCSLVPVPAISVGDLERQLAVSNTAARRAVEQAHAASQRMNARLASQRLQWTPSTVKPGKAAMLCGAGQFRRQGELHSASRWWCGGGEPRPDRMSFCEVCRGSSGDHG
jgi:hypothetical protein